MCFWGGVFVGAQWGCVFWGGGVVVKKGVALEGVHARKACGRCCQLGAFGAGCGACARQLRCAVVCCGAMQTGHETEHSSPCVYVLISYILQLTGSCVWCSARLPVCIIH